MSLQTINLGTYANDGTGDDLRTAFTKVNSNFAALTLTSGISSAANLGTGVGIWADKNLTNLRFKSLTSTGASVTITSTTNTVNLESATKVSKDTSPILGGNLNLNNFYISGGDTKTTVHGYDQRISDNLLALLMRNNTFTVDLGSFSYPTGYDTVSRGYNVDFGTGFLSTNNHVNFGNYSTVVGLEDSNNHKLTLTGNLVTSGGYNLTLNLSGNSNLTLPTGGTLAVAGSGLGQFGTTTSSQLRTIMSDPTGTGALVFGTSPTLSNPTVSGNITLGGNTSTGTTGTGSIVFSNSPILTSPTINGSITGITNIDTSSASTSFFPSPTTANLFSQGTAITIGANTGTTTVSNTLTASSPTFNISVNTASTSFNLYNTTATTINAFGASTTINVAANAASATTLYVGSTTKDNILSISGNTTTGTASLSSNVVGGTANVFVGVTGSVNIGGTASTVSIGNNSGNSTLSIIGNGTGGTSTITSNVTTGTANIYGSVTGTINLGATALAVNIGVSTGTTTIAGATAITNLKRVGLEITPPNYITVATTATYSLSNTVTENILLVTATALTITPTFPNTGVVDGQKLRFTIAVNNATLAGTGGATLVGTFAGAVTAPTTFTYIYRTSNTTWYRQ
jgi:hypothetical protein